MAEFGTRFADRSSVSRLDAGARVSSSPATSNAAYRSSHRCRTRERLAVDCSPRCGRTSTEDLRRRMLERFAARAGDVRAALHDLCEEA
jgi:hypothetical protein